MLYVPGLNIGTVVDNDVVELGTNEAPVFPNLTAFTFTKFVPVKLTFDIAAPLLGENEVSVGADADSGGKYI